MMDADSDLTIYEFVGGEETFRKLVDEFYRRVEADTTLRKMFPADLAPGKEYQFFFLSQYFGGPTTYMEQRGHPRLRMRHMPFVIDGKARDAWLGHMLASIDHVGIDEPARSAMREYFERASEAMINTYRPIGNQATDGT
jgi:hemoglobin